MFLFFSCKIKMIEDFSNVITAKEAHEIIEFAKKKGMKRSKIVPIPLLNYSSKARTSTNTFIERNEFTPAVERLAEFVSKKTGYPIDNQTWQIVHYEPGQQYKVHHDGLGRMYTMFVYLNTVEEGGETYFPNINRKVKPVLGHAVLWKNYKVERWMGLDWMVMDNDAEHAGLPPSKGEKWGINVWVRDHVYWKWDYVQLTMYYGSIAVIIISIVWMIILYLKT